MKNKKQEPITESYEMGDLIKKMYDEIAIRHRVH